MEYSDLLYPGLAIWLIAIAAVGIVSSRGRGSGSGLILAYCASLWLIHWPSAALFVFAAPLHDPARVASGFEQSVFAVAAFAAGGIFMLLRDRSQPVVAQPQTGSGIYGIRLAAWSYLLLGLVAYFLILPRVLGVSTINALVASSWNMVVFALCIFCWRAWEKRRRLLLQVWILSTLALPLATAFIQGYIGYGTGAAIAVLAFTATFYRPRWQVVAAAVALAYVGLSLYISYYRDRNTIREVIGTNSALSERMERMAHTINTFEWFDPSNALHQRRIDERLNQNALVGAALHYLDSGLVEYGKGETIWQAVAAMFPRFLWPDKPVIAGSMDVVSRYTGMRLYQNTSIGIGHVMEFHINFGTVGVIIGSLLLGLTLGAIDVRAGRALHSGDWGRFGVWYAMGFSFLQVGGSLVDLTASAGSAAIAVLLVNRLLKLPELAIRPTRVSPDPRLADDPPPPRPDPRHPVIAAGPIGR